MEQEKKSHAEFKHTSSSCGKSKNKVTVTKAKQCKQNYKIPERTAITSTNYDHTESHQNQDFHARVHEGKTEYSIHSKKCILSIETINNYLV